MLLGAAYVNTIKLHDSDQHTQNKKTNKQM